MNIKSEGKEGPPLHSWAMAKMCALVENGFHDTVRLRSVCKQD